MVSCAGVGLKPNFDSGMESKARAILLRRPVVALRSAVDMGSTGGPAFGAGVWATRLQIGRSEAATMVRRRDMMTPGWRKRGMKMGPETREWNEGWDEPF